MEVRELRKLYKSIRQDSVHEQASYDIVLNSFREMLPSKTKLNYNFYLSLRPVAVSLLAFVFVFIAGFGTIAVAKNAVPGDLLYSVKKAAEKSHMALIFDQSKKAVLYAEILTNRLSEAKVLTEKAKGGDKKYELELNVLAQNFTNDLKVLKKQIGDQVIQPQDSIIPFPDEDLLYIDEQITGQASLPIEDNRQIYTVMPSEELEKLLSETKELLAEDNLALAFVRLQEAEKLVEEQEPVTEEDQEEATDQEEKAETEEQETLPVQPVEPVIENDLSGSVGQILLLKKQEGKDVSDVSIDGTKRAEDANIGVIIFEKK